MTLLALACGSDGGPSSDGAHSFTVTDSAGVQLAVTSFSAPVPEAGWLIDPASEIEFGGAGEDIHFTWIAAATQLPDGRVVAIDPRAPELFVFARSGELLARTGREGDGPGEFSRPAGVIHLGGDTILVHDGGHMRFSLFDVDGNFLDDRRLEPPEGGEDAPRLTMYAAVDAVGDTLTLRGQGFAFRSDGSGGQDYVWENPSLRYTTDGRYLGEVAEPTKMWFTATSSGPRPVLFGGAQDVIARDGVVFVADRERYEVRVHDPPHGLVRIQRLERARRPVTDDMLEAYRVDLAENIQDPNARRATLRMIADSPVADSLPWIQNVMADPLGNAWVIEHAPPGEAASVGVFSPEGEWRGVVPMPPDFRPLEIGADYVLGVVRDELDVPHLVRYELDRGPPSRP